MKMHESIRLVFRNQVESAIAKLPITPETEELLRHWRQNRLKYIKGEIGYATWMEIDDETKYKIIKLANSLN